MKKKLILVFIVITSIFLTFGVLAGCSGTKTNESNKATDSQTTPTPKPVDTFDLNETVTLKNMKITALSIDKSEGAALFKPAEGNIFYGVKFKIENISDSEISINSIRQFESFYDNTKASTTLSALSAFGNTKSISGTVEAGADIEGILAIEVSKSAKTLKIIFKPDTSSSETVTFELSTPEK